MFKRTSPSHTESQSDSEAKPRYAYPNRYRPRPIEAQIEVIANAFQLDPMWAHAFAANLPELPKGAEAWFAIPSVEAVAKKHFSQNYGPSDQYCRAVQFVLEKLAELTKLRTYREGYITPERLRVRKRTAVAVAEIAREMPSDIHIVPAQLGFRYCGISARHARDEFSAREFGLTTFAVGAILLSHPDRFVHVQEFGIECAGDEFLEHGMDDSPYADVPTFFSLEKEAAFDGHCWSYPFDSYGSATGFVPEQ
ncbi:hypothetical protein ACKWRH_03725 [Bradyrhizobium sp. Pa8]|uniref:hypothetical protein n=1 Tax=Bradyrhizobium sp. Pa8 TaxID=3386552 RepID=UPI00403F7C4F